MIIKSVGAFSVGKIMGIVNAVMGLIIGVVFALVGTLGLMAGVASGGGDSGPGGIMTLVFGAGAIIALPIIYGLMGFIGGLIMALVYNFVAGIIGGIELNVDQ